MTSRIFTLAAAVMLLGGSALADEQGFQATKSKQKAIGYSIAASLGPAIAGAAVMASSSSSEADMAGLGLLGLGLAVGPNLGRLYADGSFSASRSWGRLLGVGLTVLGVSAATNTGDQRLEAQTAGWRGTGSLAVAGIGVSIIALSTVQDIVAAVRAVEDFNRPSPKVSWSMGFKYFAQEKALGASVTFKF